MAFPLGPKFKHREVYEQLRAAILDGRYGPGQRLPTDGQLMRKFQTSRPTVARAMRDLQVDGLLERRSGAGSFVRLPANQATKPLGMLVPSLNEMQIFAPICGEIARTVERHSFHLHFAEIHFDKSQEQIQQAQQACRRLIEQKVIGVFFAPMEFSEQMETINACVGEMLEAAHIAVVLLDSDLEHFPKRSKFDLVGVYNHRIGYMQAEHLLGLGCRHIEYLAVPLSRPTVEGGWKVSAKRSLPWGPLQRELGPLWRSVRSGVRRAACEKAAGSHHLRQRLYGGQPHAEPVWHGNSRAEGRADRGR